MQKAPKKIVTYIYNILNSQNCSPTSGMNAWVRDLSGLRQKLEWQTIWKNVTGASKNPNHQFIHLKFCHRAYVTPRIRYQMGLVSDPYCSFCSPGTIGSFTHVVWECPGIAELWKKAIDIISILSGVKFPLDPSLHLLNDDSLLSLTEKTQKIWLAGLTAVKKIIAQQWKPPLDISSTHWLRSFLDISYLELSSARINGAKQNTISNWTNLISNLKDILSNEGSLSV